MGMEGGGRWEPRSAPSKNQSVSKYLLAANLRTHSKVNIERDLSRKPDCVRH